jgi:DNA-binding transcriptional LysR family regulator
MDDILAGRLVRVLPAVHGGDYPLGLVLARGTHLSARVRLLGDFLQTQLSVWLHSTVKT